MFRRACLAVTRYSLALIQRGNKHLQVLTLTRSVADIWTRWTGSQINMTAKRAYIVLGLVMSILCSRRGIELGSQLPLESGVL